MNRARSVLGLLLVIALIAGLRPRAEGQSGRTMPVSGVVINAAGMPIGGLIVRLLHDQLGPSSPSMTNASGFYFIANVPTNVPTPYRIEVRWGRQIVYLDYVRHLGQQEPLRLR